jgi:hypothetical protein
MDYKMCNSLLTTTIVKSPAATTACNGPANPDWASRNLNKLTLSGNHIIVGPFHNFQGNWLEPLYTSSLALLLAWKKHQAS